MGSVFGPGCQTWSATFTQELTPLRHVLLRPHALAHISQLTLKERVAARGCQSCNGRVVGCGPRKGLLVCRLCLVVWWFDGCQCRLL
jgi:hypothetical protein